MKGSKKPKVTQTTIKQYCLITTGQILPCRYRDGTLRNIHKEGDQWFITHDEYAHNMIITYCHRIIAFSDSVQELERIKK